MIVLWHFSLWYLIKNNIEIVGFWDNRQDPIKMFELIEN